MNLFRRSTFQAAGIAIVLTALIQAQQNPPIMVAPPRPAQQPKPQTNQPGQPGPAQGLTPVPMPARGPGGFNLHNVSLIEVIELLARALKIDYILDPRVKGSVSISTFGELKPVDMLPMLETILRINGAAMVKVGDLYRIVPLADVSRLPISPSTTTTIGSGSIAATSLGAKEQPDDERMLLNLIFLKYATAPEMFKLLEPFLGESAKMTSYDPANLLLILDNARNMKRTLEMIALFDSDSFAGQRVRLFEVSHGRPSDIVKELDAVFKAYSMSEKNSAIKFMPLDRINTIIAVAPNPGVFGELEKWIKKLDVQTKQTAGAVTNYVYRLKYSRAEIVGMAVMQLYGMPPGFGMGMMGGGFGMGGMGGGGGMGGYGGGMGGYGGGMGGYGGGMGGYGGGMGGYGGGMGGYGGGYGGGGYGGGYGGGMGGYGGGMGGYGYGQPTSFAPAAATATVTPPGTTTSVTTSGDLTGSYLGGGGGMGYGMNFHPRIIPNPFDNTLLIQGTPQEWEAISQLIEKIDISPRQVLIEAKVYEVELTGIFSLGVQSFLQARSVNGSATGSGGTAYRFFQATNNATATTLTAGLLVGASRELLALLTANESNTKVKVISAPSVIATDSIPASINVGQDVPTLSSQAVTGAQSGGTSLFANTISNRSTGVGLNILARVNSSGIVTMVINQQVSSPEPPTSGGIQSPSFQQRTVQTQVTVQDGDTVSIGGIIEESDTATSAGLPFLHRIPWLGAAFGQKSSSKSRTELVVFLTPRVIYDTNEMVEASDELKSSLKRLQKMIKE